MENIDINKNMLKDRANKKEEITEDMFNTCNPDNIEMFDDYFMSNKQLSLETRKQYTTCLKQFFYFVKTDLKDKPYYKITKRDFIKYLGDMQDRGLSSSAINLRKSAVSSFCNYIENIVSEDVEEAKNFRNFTRGMPAINKTQVYDKIAISDSEYKKMMEVLEANKNYLGMAWTATAFNVGCRRSELIQFKTEILQYDIPKGKNYVKSHIVRGKGKGKEGKPLRYMIPLEVLKYWKMWVDNRGYESEYIFTTKVNGNINHMSKSWANDFCSDVLSKIVGRRINPHLFKASCVTHLLEQGKDVKVVSKIIAQHEDVSTTLSYYDLRTFEDEIDEIFE